MNLIKCIFIMGFALSFGSLSFAEQAPKKLQNCHENAKDWPVHPGHFYDKEIHLVPQLPTYDPSSTEKKTDAEPTGYTAVFVKKGSFYDRIGIHPGDLITSVEGVSFSFKELDSISPEKAKVFEKIKQGKTFTVLRCLKIK